MNCTPKAGKPLPLNKIVVFDAKGKKYNGETIEQAIGDVIYFIAEGYDVKGRVISIKPEWGTTNPEIVEIKEMEGGRKISVKGLFEGETCFFVTSDGIRNDFVCIKFIIK